MHLQIKDYLENNITKDETPKLITENSFNDKKCDRILK